MSIEKYIKTQCGLEKFNHLRKLADKSLIDKIKRPTELIGNVNRNRLKKA